MIIDRISRCIGMFDVSLTVTPKELKKLMKETGFLKKEEDDEVWKDE